MIARLLAFVLSIAIWGCDSKSGHSTVRSLGPIAEVTLRRGAFNSNDITEVRTERAVVMVIYAKSVPLGDTLWITADSDGRNWVSWDNKKSWNLAR